MSRSRPRGVPGDNASRERPLSPHAVPGRAARLAAPAALLAAVTAAFAYVAAVDPNEPGHYPVCPLLHLTGLYCPGCGGLRSAHAVAHGDLAAALQANAPAVLGYAAFAVLWTVWVVRAARGRPRASTHRPRCCGRRAPCCWPSRCSGTRRSGAGCIRSGPR